MSISPSLIKYITGRMSQRRGENAEQSAVRALKEAGWVAGRVRRGPVDVIAAKDGRSLLIQVKSGMARAKATELELVVKWAQAFNADGEVWYYRGRGKVVRRRVFAAKRDHSR